MDQKQESNTSVNKNVGKFVTDGLKEAWNKFMEKFQQSFDLNQLDPVLSFLRESNCQKNPKIEFMEEEEEMSGENNNQNDAAALLEKQVFGNHLSAKSIFKYLSNWDLLSCRLTNSYWKESATELLLKRDFKIEFQRNINRLYLKGSKLKSLDMFTQLLKSSKSFPCNKFVLQGGNLGNEDAQRFFNFYGDFIKSIHIIICYDEDPEDDKGKSEKGFSVGFTDSRVMGRILSQQLPNLEDLTLDLRFENNNEWSGFECFLFPPGEKVELPNLKKITYFSTRDDDLGCDDDTALLSQLLVAATNLKSFSFHESFDMEYLDPFIETGKVKCIDCVDFSRYDLEEFQEMVKYELGITSIHLDDLRSWYIQPENRTEVSTIFTQLLKSSRKSLNTICGLRSLGFLPQLVLPILQNVTRVHIRLQDELFSPAEGIDDHYFAFLPRGATFSRNFPRLHSLELWFQKKVSSEDAAAWWTQCFPTDEIVKTVKKLRISESRLCPLLWMEKLGEMFPNVEQLSIDTIYDFPNFSKTIWKNFTKVKHLCVDIDLPSPSNVYPALDSSFTGFSPEVCKKLGNFSTSELESMAKNYTESQPSLLNLTDLRTLKMHFKFPSSVHVLNSDYSKAITQLVGICVFKRLKNLHHVNIHYSGWVAAITNNSFVRSLELLVPYKVKITCDED